MGANDLTAEDLKKLAEWDTPTICNGLEHLSAEYRVKSFTVEQMQCFDPSLVPIVGYARTAMIRSMSPPEGSPVEIREMRAKICPNKINVIRSTCQHCEAIWQ